MLIINKHSNYEEQLLSILDNDATRFELLSLTIDWGLQRISRLPEDKLSELEVRNGIYMLTVEKSYRCDTELKVMFSYNRSGETLTLIAARKVS